MKKKLITGLLALTMSVALCGGIVGCSGNDGADGAPGKDGTNGVNGKSAYELWLDAGNTGSVEDFLASLKGEQGDKGENGKDGVDGAPGKDGVDGANGKDGADGKDGVDGAPGKDGVDGAPGKDGVDGAPGKDGEDGEDGKSAFDLWLEAGNVGTVEDFLASLKGEAGKDGEDGEDAYVCEEHTFSKVKVVANNETCTSIAICSECGWAEFVLNDHNFKATTVSATCIALGYTANKCEDCGFEADVVYDEEGGYADCAWKLTESSDVWYNMVTGEFEATSCVVDGTVSYECSVCEETKTDTYEKLAHTATMDGTTAVVNPGETMCENGGMWVSYCERCHEVVTELVDPIGHDVAEWTIVGLTAVGTCSAENGHCGNKVTVELPELNKDNYEYVQCNCKSEDTFDRYYIYIDNAGNLYTEATEGATKKLVAEVNVYATYHILGEDQMKPVDGVIYVLNTTEGVREFAGQKATSCLPEGYGAGYFFCEVCGEDVEVVTYTAHNFDDEACVEVEKEPAYCSKEGLVDGLKWVYCANGCGEYDEVVVEAPAHVYEYEIVKNEDETLNVKVTCENCEYEQLLEGVTEKERVEPTCEEDGYVIYTATVGEEVINTDKFTLPATGHYVVVDGEKVYMNEEKYDITLWADYIKEFVGQKADCDPVDGKEGAGYFDCACEDCEDPIEVVTFRTHTYDPENSELEEATCTTPAYRTGTCEFCGTVSDREVVAPANGHLVEEAILMTKAEALEAGETIAMFMPDYCVLLRAVCSNCEDLNMVKVVDTTKFGEWTVNENCIKVWTYTWTVELDEVLNSTVNVTVSMETVAAHVITVDGVEEVISETAPYDVVKYAAYVKEFAGQKATCLANGKGYIVCEKCDESVEVFTSTNVHVYDKYEEVDATCTEDAYKVGTCTVCGTEATTVLEGTKLGHNYTEKMVMTVAEILEEYDDPAEFLADLEELGLLEAYEAVVEAEGIPAVVGMFCEADEDEFHVFYAIVDLAVEENVTKDVEATCGHVGEKVWTFEFDAEVVGTKADVTVVYSEEYAKVDHAPASEADEYAWQDVYTDGKTYNFYGFICQDCKKMIITEMDVVYTVTVYAADPTANPRMNFEAWCKVVTFKGTQNGVNEEAYTLAALEDVTGFKFGGYEIINEDGEYVEFDGVVDADLYVTASWYVAEYFTATIIEDGETSYIYFGAVSGMTADGKYVEPVENMAWNLTRFDAEWNEVANYWVEEVPETFELKDYTFTQYVAPATDAE